MRMYSLCIGYNITRQYSWTNQVWTPLTCRYLSCSLNISCSISTPGSKISHGSCVAWIICGIWWWFFHSTIHEGSHNTTQNRQILCNADHKAVHHIILTSSILGSPHIVRKIPAKPKVASRVSPHRIIITRSRYLSPYHT